MTPYQQRKANLQATPKTWLITGVAGFIGSNLLETLLKLDQRVVGLDNVATGHQRNLDEVQTLATPAQWQRSRDRDFRPGDVRHSLADISKARDALGYVPTQRLSDGLAIAIPWYIAKA